MTAMRPVLYREVLTPALHRRFTSSALLALVICYIESILIAQKSSFIWTWFPIGVAGIRTLLLFVSAISVFILSVASLHLGRRTGNSPATSFLHSVFRLNTLQTIGWYGFSAWWFSEVYIWSASEKAELGWITSAKAWERSRLNERPIYLRSVFLMFAIAQSILHVLFDADFVSLQPGQTIETQPTGLQAWCTTKLDLLRPMFTYDTKNIPKSVCNNVVLRTILISLLAPLFYGIFIRRTAWSWTLSFARLILNVPPTTLSYIPPHYPSLVLRSLTGGLLLNFLWQASSVMFAAYVAQQPIKNGQPLSSQSTDPIGTLLLGLRSKKEIPKTFAFWELSLIVSSFPNIRKAVFTDIDRSSGPVWSQISTLCLDEIASVRERVNTFLRPSPPASALSNSQPQQQSVQIESLPRISTPLRQEQIFTPPPAPSTPLEKIEANIGALAKAYGQSPTPGTLTVPFRPQATALVKTGAHTLLASPPARKLITAATPTVKGGSSSEKNPASQTASAFSPTLMIHNLSLRILRSPFLGPPFRQTFSRRTTAIVLGSPLSTLPSTLSATRALTALCLASFSEDHYGRVAKDIPTVIRTLCGTVQTVEALLRNLPPHWTDIAFCAEHRNQVEDVEILLTELKSGLRQLVDGFGGYIKELGVADSEWVVVRTVAGLEAKN